MFDESFQSRNRAVPEEVTSRADEVVVRHPKPAPALASGGSGRLPPTGTIAPAASYGIADSGPVTPVNPEPSADPWNNLVLRTGGDASCAARLVARCRANGHVDATGKALWDLDRDRRSWRL
jgi:hypothetical protein